MKISDRKEVSNMTILLSRRTTTIISHVLKLWAMIVVTLTPLGNEPVVRHLSQRGGS